VKQLKLLPVLMALKIAKTGWQLLTKVSRQSWQFPELSKLATFKISSFGNF